MLITIKTQDQKEFKLNVDEKLFLISSVVKGFYEGYAAAKSSEEKELPKDSPDRE